MRTLNEVIRANECCDHGEPDSRCEECPYNGLGACCAERETDALHYLKEYQGYLIGKEISKAFDEAFTEMYNPPLTWDELCMMEGKPVWIEVLSDEIDLSSRWMMVARETKAHSLPLAYTDNMGHWIFGHEDKLGKTWQAYRKERNETRI